MIMAPHFRRLLVPHDFSSHATRALRVAADLAARDRGRLIVLYVITPILPRDGGPLWLPEARLVAECRRALASLVARTLRGRRLPTPECRVVVGAPAERILDAARGVDVIVMSTLGRTGLPRLVIGSVAEKVVRHSPVPVVTIRARPAVVRRRPRRGRRGPVALRAA